MFHENLEYKYLNSEGDYDLLINDNDIPEDNKFSFDDIGPINESKNPFSTIYTANIKEEEIIKEKKNDNQKDFHINTISPSKKPKEKNLLLGRKKKNSHEIGKHNKYTDDNLINKATNAVKDSAFKHVNKNIKESLGDEYTLKKIRPFSKKIDSIKELMKKTCGDVLSTEPRKKYKNLDKNHNQKMIEKILDKEKENETHIFNDLFKLKFSDYLYNFRLAKNEMRSELSGMENIDDFLSKFKDEEYKNKFKAFVGDLEKIIGDKKGRNRPKKSKII